MAALLISRWVLIRLATRPAIVLLLIALALCVPLAEQLRPTPNLQGTVDTALAWCFPAGLLGVCLGLVTLSRDEGLLRRLEPRSRWAGGLGALLTSAALLQLPIIAGATSLGTHALDWLSAAPAILGANLRLAGVALMLLVPALPTAQRTLLFLSATWILPALLGDGSVITQLLDAGAALRSPEPTGLLSSYAAASALGIAGYLLHAGLRRRSLR